MQSSIMRCATLAMAMATTALALDGITVPATVAGGVEFDISFQNPGDDQYRVYLAAAVTGRRGPSCYLKNSTDLSSPLALTIPADVGQSADYYSIAIADLTTGQGATYSQPFNFTGGTGNATQYEEHLGGAPFWDADSLPCTAISCARDCAQAGYPNDLTEVDAYNTMKACILGCPGVTADFNQTAPVHSNEKTDQGAEVTLASGLVVSAVETTVSSGGKTFTEAIVASHTLTLGQSAVTLSTHTISLASSGIDVDGKTTVPFTAQVATATSTSASGAAASASSTSAPASKGSAGRTELGALGAAIAGLAAVLL